MWYVVQVTSGKENQVCNLIKRAVANDEHVKEEDTQKRVLAECFSPVYQAERKLAGRYTLFDKKLFPGYVIAISHDVGELNRVLRGVSAFTRILGNGNAFIPLDRTEAAFINSFTSEKHRVILTSRAVAEGDTIRVVEGPLVGREGWIRKINRRKGTAVVETSAFGRMLSVELGLAVMSKQD